MKKIKKYIRCILFAVMSSYVLATIISAVMMSHMTQIIHNSTGWGVTLREIIIDFKTNTAQRNHYNFNREQTKNEEYSIDTIEVLKIKMICTFSLFPLWREHYVNPNVMDGDQWNMVRSYENDKNVIYGSNAYPLTYWLVFSEINNAFNNVLF